MKERGLTIPDIIMLAGTRVVLGAGVGLILAGKIDDSKRKGAGWALLAVGALTTIPIILNVLGKGPPARSVRELPAERLTPVI